MSKWNLLVFGVYPYVALAICLIGSWARFDLSQYTWKAGSSQMLNQRGMRVASNFFHIGVLFVLAGHFVGLLTPASIYHHVISTENKQLLAMVSGGFFGLLCLIGLLMLVNRRLSDPRVRATSSPSDILILLVLLAQLLLGLLTIVASTGHAPLLSRDEQRHTVTGLEFWFRPEPGQKPAKRYKQFLLTLAVIFPLTMAVPIAVRWATARSAWLENTIAEHLMVAAIVVGLMTYVLMPRVTRLAAAWLYK